MLGAGCCALLAGLSLYSAAGFALAPINPMLTASLAPGHAIANAQQVRLGMATARSREALPDEIVWTFNRAGEFDFACLIAGHFQAGMVGKVMVTAAGKAS